MMKNGVLFQKGAALGFLLLTAGCSSIPNSVRLFAAELPARADGQYALLSDDLVRKQLVLKDSELQCRIDIEDGTTEEKSSACLCAKSIDDWRVDCKGWLGAHVPAPAESAPTEPTTPVPAAPVPAPAPAPVSAPPNG